MVGTGTATVIVTVNAVNDAPIANHDVSATDEDMAVTVNVHSNDSAGPANEDQTLTTTSVTVPLNGTAIIEDDGSIMYTPALNYNGSDSFEYEVCDSEGLCDTATVDVNIAAVNDASTLTVDPSSQSVDYSDGIVPITVTAVDVDTAGQDMVMSTAWQKDSDPVVAGLPGSLVLTPLGNSGSIIPGERSWELSGGVDFPAGTYTISLSVEGGGIIATTDVTLLVEPEDVSITF